MAEKYDPSGMFARGLSAVANAADGVARGATQLQIAGIQLIKYGWRVVHKYWWWLLALLWVAQLLGAIMLVREIQPIRWLRTRIDYVFIKLLNCCGPRPRLVRFTYSAASRLLSYYFAVPRPRHQNSREYYQTVAQRIPLAAPAMAQITRLFERLRYGRANEVAGELRGLADAYAQLYRAIGNDFVERGPRRYRTDSFWHCRQIQNGRRH